MSMKHTMSAYGDSKSIVEWRRVRFDNTITLCRQKQQMIIARCHSRYPRVRAARRRRQRVVRARVEKKDVNVCVMVSGGGSNLKSLHRASVEGRLGGGTIKAVVSDKPGCGGWKFAQENGIATLKFVGDSDDNHSGLLLAKTLREEFEIDIVLLAGFLKLIPSSLCEQYKNAMLNIHPALLPSFGGKGYYGERVHKAVIASGVRVSGPTIHFVTAEYDRGPILAQQPVPVLPLDTPATLAARVLEAEHELYPKAASALCGGKVLWRDDGIPYYDN